MYSDESVSVFSTSACRRCTQRGSANLGDVLAVDADDAALDVIEAEEQPDDGALTSATRPHQRVRLTGRNRKRHVP